MSDDKQDQQDDSRPGLFDKIGNLFNGVPKNKKELLEIIQGAKQREIIDQKTKEMIKGVLDVSKLRVRDIMIPRSQMVTLDITMKIDEFLPTILESAHSRFPVVNDDIDHVEGILLAKDLLAYGFKQKHQDFCLFHSLYTIVSHAFENNTIKRKIN